MGVRANRAASRARYAALGVSFRRAITALAMSMNLSCRNDRRPASVDHANLGTQPMTGAVAAHITPVCRTHPVISREEIANLQWSPIIAPRNCCPVCSVRPSGSAREVTWAYVFSRLLLVVPAPRFDHSPTKESPRCPSWALFAYPWKIVPPTRR